MNWWTSLWIFWALSTNFRDGFDWLVNGSIGRISFYWNTPTGNNSSPDVSHLRWNAKIKCKEYYFISFPTLACRSVSYTTWYSSFPDCAITEDTSTIKMQLHLQFDVSTKYFCKVWCFYVIIWSGMASSRTISWSATYEILTYFRRELGFAS